MAIRVCVAGAIGWTGRAVTGALLGSSDFQLVGAIARRQVGVDIGEALGHGRAHVPIVASLEEALAVPTDVLIDYTAPEVVKEHILAALDKGVRVVVGTSGLTANDYSEIEQRAQARQLGVIAAGNFSLTAALAKHFALIAAQYLPSWEIIDYASVLSAIFAESIGLDHPAYDSAFTVLAERLKVPFITADRKLHNKLIADSRASVLLRDVEI